MADDIVTLLRQVVSFDGGLAHVVDPLAADAADEIERLQRIIIELRAEVQRLQAVCTRDN